MQSKVDNDNWIRCGRCGHKLFRLLSHPIRSETLLEIKCHSCRTINTAKISAFTPVLSDFNE